MPVDDVACVRCASIAIDPSETASAMPVKFRSLPYVNLSARTKRNSRVKIDADTASDIVSVLSATTRSLSWIT
jgi:hypothetical protein